MNIITSSRSKYELNEAGIIIQEAMNDKYLDLDMAKEEVATVIKLAAGKKKPLLVISNHNKGMSREARKYYISDFLTNHTTAVALYTNSKMMKMIGSFFLGWQKTPYPFKIFDDKEVALEWLKGYVANDKLKHKK